MPYKTILDLPDSVKNHLPKHGLEIYIAAFNAAWNEYHSVKKRKNNATQEETAHRVAWAAVKKKYKKENDKWILK